MEQFKSMLKRGLIVRGKSFFTIGYSLIFPIVIIAILGKLLSNNFGNIISSYEYYTYTMVPFCCLLCIITAAYAGKDEAYSKTAIRFLMAPIKPSHIVLTKLISCTFVFGVCNVIVFFVCNYIFPIDIIDKLFGLILFMTMLTFSITAIGLFIGLGMKNFITIKNFVNLPICLFAIVSGTFYQVYDTNGIMGVIKNISPLTWINKSIFMYVFDHDIKLLVTVSIILLGIGFLFTILSVKYFNREEFINGELPSYEN